MSTTDAKPDGIAGRRNRGKYQRPPMRTYRVHGWVWVRLPFDAQVANNNQVAAAHNVLTAVRKGNEYRLGEINVAWSDKPGETMTWTTTGPGLETEGGAA